MTYHIALETDGRRTDADAERKIRALLSRLAKTYGVRVVKVTSAKEHDRVRSN